MRRTAKCLVLGMLSLSPMWLAACSEQPTEAPPVAHDVLGNCVTIASGNLVDSFGRPLELGYDEFGYNYNAHLFNGTYDGVDRKLDGKYFGTVGDYVDDKLMMQWSDEWISNQDCNGDGKLDRGLIDGVADGISKGWTTNHVMGDYSDASGTHNYTYFVKIVWTGPGSPLWGQYTVIQELYNDPYGGNIRFKQSSPGFGLNDQWTVSD